MAYVGGWLGHYNLGDEALFDAYRMMFPGISLYTVQGRPEDVALARMTRAFHCAMLAGGTIINKNNDCLMRARRMLGMAKRCFVFGTGVADAAFWQGRNSRGGGLWANNLSQWRDVLEQCAYVGVRGPLSQRILMDAGVSRVEVIGDPVLAFAGCAAHTGYEEKTLGLNLGTAAGHVWGNNEESVFRCLVNLATLARNAGWKVIWLVVWPQDYAMTENAAKESETGEHIHAIYTDHTQYLSLVSKSSVFVGMKLHAVVLATCAGVPSVMLEYRPKCRDYMESIQQGHFCQRVDQADVTRLWDLVQAIHGKREEYARQMFEGVSRLRALQQQRAQQIAEQMRINCQQSA